MVLTIVSVRAAIFLCGHRQALLFMVLIIAIMYLTIHCADTGRRCSFTMLTIVSVHAAISLCGHRQALRHALDLVGEMRSRSIACNTHTYSSLMNVAIKCGELELALDVFHQLQVTCSRADM